MNSNSQTLNRYTAPTSISRKKEDVNSPFSFRDWFAIHNSIIPTQEYAQYNEYLINWYKEKSKTTNTVYDIKLKYLGLLRQLQVFLSKEETENWYNNINFDSDKELLLATPFFAKKLKDISFYYSRLRETIKESKLRYNQTGTEFGIVSQLQKHVLTEYTKRATNGPVLIPSSFWSSIPELSAIKDSIVIQLEELYDDHSYLDHSPSVPLSSYYDLNSSDVENFLTTKNLNLSSLNWIYSSGILPVSAVSEDDDINVYTNLLARKYLGQDQYTTEIFEPIDLKDFFNIPIIEGSNFFYWPSYTYDSNTEKLPLYQPQSLSSSNLTTLGTAGSSIDIADTIFIKTKNGVSGAWLRSNIFNTTSATMNAMIEASTKTSFRFPFPGFGLSAEDLEWTGFELSSNKRYKYLKDEIREAIEKQYWGSSIELSSVDPIKINDTTLILNQAQPGKNITHADKLRYFYISPPYDLESSSNIFEESWLYKFTQTDIPIKAGDSNTILWPYERIDPEESFPTNYPSNFSEICESIDVSSLNNSLAISSPYLSSSDIIYKIKRYQDTIEDATECCWLSSGLEILQGENVLSIPSNGLQIQVSSNNYTRFIWNGADYTDANKIFKFIQHSPECLYLNDVTNTYESHEKCTCRSILFSPFGHPGQKYSDYESLTDFIVEDDTPLEPLDLSTKNTSLSTFGWFKTASQIGWDKGSWYSNNAPGNIFYLRKNKKYIYFRTGSKKNDLILPSYTKRYNYSPSGQKVWIRAKKDSEGNWISTSEPSKMIISPGDLLIYERKSTTHYLLSGLQEEIIDVSENKGSIWSNIDYFTPAIDKSIIVGYPSFGYTTNPDPQYPDVPLNNILQVIQWSLSAPNQPIHYFKDATSFSFIPTLTGIYTIGLTALSGDPQSVTTTIDTSGNFLLSYDTAGIYIFNNIPAITAIPNTTLIPSYSSVEISIPGYVLNTQLNGWDYNTGTYNPFALVADRGAQPFWARVYYDDHTQFSRYPGIETPQRFFDEHNVITQPQISDIVMEMGARIDYYRNYPTKFNWIQPLTIISSSENSSWCSLDISLTSSNINEILNSYKEELIIKPTNNISPISLVNKINNEPVEIYYNAINAFTWEVTATPQKNTTSYIEPTATLAIEAIMPYANLANQHFPTFAVFPTIENLYSKSKTGGYFIPRNFGASKYLNKNYTLNLNVSSTYLSGFFNESEKFGLTKTIQNSPYEILIEDSFWLKEPLNSNALAGNINKQVFKTHQKFIPYQSSSEIDHLTQTGIIDIHTLQDPWSEEETPEWKDKNNHPISFEGKLNISEWTESQLQFNNLHMDQWVSDIFGNQYGLYKNINLSASIPEKREEYGQIWVKNNAQRILPAVKALSGVFDTYQGTSIINELTGTGIKKIDVFFDTLMIETSSILFFEKIGYDFDNDQIYSIADNSRRLSLGLIPANLILLQPLLSSGNLINGFLVQQNGLGILTQSNSIDIKFGETWFFPIEKKVIVSIAATYNDIIFPELYEIDIQTLTLKKIFPTVISDITDIVSLSSEEFTFNARPLLSYNPLKKEYLMVISFFTRKKRTGFLQLIIDDKEIPFLHEIKVFQSILAETYLPYISQNLSAVVVMPSNLNFACTVDNGPATFNGIGLPSWVSLSLSGDFTGIPTISGDYFAPFSVTNTQGTTYYSLNITVL